MEKLKKIFNIILLILFPVGMLYCLIHTIGKDFACFLGALSAVAIGILLGIWIVQPEIIQGWIDTVASWFVAVKGLFGGA